MDTAILKSLQVGKPAIHETPDAKNPMEREWSTGIFKSPVSGPLWLGKINLRGDEQADLTVHGGVDKAVLGYFAGHYPLWRKELRLREFPFGAFGENFTIEGLNEETTSIGDTFEVGEAVVQVAQPRQPCWKLARRWQNKYLPARVVETGRSGWYFRVVKEGTVEAGQQMQLIERHCAEWTIARVNEILYEMDSNLSDAKQLSGCEFLAEGLRGYLAHIVERDSSPA